MRSIAVFVALLACLGCSAPDNLDSTPGIAGQTSGIAGTYVGWMFMDGRFTPTDGSLGVSQKLILRPNNSYTFQMESTAMMQASVKAQGTYSRTGDDLRLTGTMTSFMDDGYKKGSRSGPHQMSLRIENDMLAMRDGKNDPFYFRKVGTGPPPIPPELQLEESDSAALALLRKVEKTYASLLSYMDAGTVKSGGGGFVAKDAKFRTLFQRPSKFRFEASQFDGGKEFDRVEITWNGGAKCWWYTTEFGETADRPLANAMSIAAVNFGPEIDLVPPLLLPDAFRGATLAEQYPEVTLLKDEMIDGRECSVLGLKSKGTDVTKLWIDKKNHMILRLYEELREVIVTFKPSTNAQLKPAMFLLGKRSKLELK
ncbi:MAG: hypothetical protein H0W86_03275 [Armatimonadetes bacterium]|nr:hypothetical protein [Armatimonadota bacterium]